MLFHAINHVGLGHINRAIAVAQWLKAGIPNVEVLFLIEGGEDFIEPTGFPWIYVYSQVHEMVHTEQVMRKVLEVFQPDLMVHETILREPLHRPIREAGIPQVLMGNVGELMRGQLRENLAMINEVRLLLILQQQSEVLEKDQVLISKFRGKTLFAGPLVRQKQLISGADLRQKLGLGTEEQVILVTFGGGGYDMARKLLANLLATRDEVQASYPLARLAVITGPHFSAPLPEIDDFVCYASRFEPFISDYVNISSAVVCMAGYNTVNEIASSGVPAVCVPVADSDDQVGLGSIGEYAKRFPNIAVGSNDTPTLARLLLEALGKERDLAVTQEFQQRAESASRSIIDGIKSLLPSA